MANLVAIQPELHRHLHVQPQFIESHSAGQHLIPVIPAEVTHVATDLPVVLTKNGDTGQFVLAALTGFKPGENLLWQQGEWQGLYLPLQIQRQPFFVGKASPEAEDYTVCIHIDSPAVWPVQTPSTESQNTSLNHPPIGAEPLFLADGRESEFYQAAKAKLLQLLQGEQQAAQLIDTLIALELLQPMALEITFTDNSSTRLQGLYTVDANKIAQLTPEALLRLHQSGFLAMVFAIANSSAQIYRLIARKNQQLAVNHG